MSRLLCVLFSTCTTDERVVWLRLAHDYELKQFASGLRSGSLFTKAPPEWNLRYGRSPLKRDVLFDLLRSGSLSIGCSVPGEIYLFTDVATAMCPVNDM